MEENDKKNRSRESLIDLYARHVSPGKAEFYQKYDITLLPGQRESCFIHDINGKRYYNCHCNGGVFNLGHRNPAIIQSVIDAMETYDIGNHHLISKPKALLGKMLAETMPTGLNQVVYGVSGGEAVDLAIKLARGITGREEIISASGGYHGHTGLAMATGDRRFQEKFGPTAPGFKQVAFNSTSAMEEAVTSRAAAVILETIPATLGIVVPQKEYLSDVREICSRNGCLLILDEVQTGFSRTGRLWGFEHFDVTPDIVVLGKGMSGGIYPISATVYHEQFIDFFKADPFLHISTFGGSEIGCLAAMETLRISRQPEFLAHVHQLGDFMTSRLNTLRDQMPGLGLEVRGIGLMLGLAFKDETTALFMIKLLFDKGVYVVYAGNDPRVIQFLPVLNINRGDAETIIEMVEACCRELSK